MTAREFQIAVLARDRWCLCGAEATVAHHLPDGRMAGKRIHDPEEGRGLCFRCHDELHSRGEQTFYAKHGLDERGHER